MTSPLANPKRQLTSEQGHLVDTLHAEVYPICQSMEAKIKRLAGENAEFSADHVFDLIKEYALLRLDGNTKKLSTELALKPLQDYIQTGYNLLAQKPSIGPQVAKEQRARDRSDLLSEVNDIINDFIPGRGTGRG